ncbi:hypothetical protein ASPSYDRAFT_38847 [Aspergillus sydowii CBS 593.65]|uniref:Uncharacterized protein n=1 Tax=Aspergillus sydowii CBS 593.65 TaxID=1036612 RepID=A0A1L9TXJ6_9EURO|nr:uncharacterized protein ASPSYDRAFT_38847 [Aspergillus sydowii CBS 593.65]OJJ64157.1 hypothetical protein ASPSYDRAFT_38847 [Aspergillus sydowii CBS 593.65]
MRPTVFLPLYLLGPLPRVIAVQLEITEIRYTNGSEPRVATVDMPYIDSSLLPKDQPCPDLPFFIREARLLTEDLTVPTRCWIYTEQCHQSLAPITNDDPYVSLINGFGRTVRCYEE